MIGDSVNLSQRLASIKMETPAQAMVILRRKQLLAHSGSLPFSAIEELVGLINAYSRSIYQNFYRQISSGLQRPGYGDLVRFIQLEGTQEKHLLYAVFLSREILLALLFHPETPFNKVRRQTLQIARDLQLPPRTTSLEFRATEIETPIQRIEPSVEPIPPHAQLGITETQPSQPLSESLSPPPTSATPVTTPLPHNSYDASETPAVPDINHPFAPGWEQIMPPTENQDNKPGTSIFDSTELEEPSSGDIPFINPQINLPVDQTAQPDETETTSSSTFGHYITYSCMLVPRMPQHLLKENLASNLFKWMGQLCLAYGWRLEHLSIHSNHIQWIAGAPLTTSPAFLVRTLRQKTSTYIFSEFPPLSRDNPSGDFWAPGFFISGGNNVIQAHLVDKFVSEIREQQGVNNPSFYP